MNKQDLSKLTKTEVISTQFYLPRSYIYSSLSHYYILHWQGSHIIDQVKTIKGMGVDIIHHHNIPYKLSFTADCHAWDIIQNPDAQYKISFRKMLGKKYGIALIKKASDPFHGNRKSFTVALQLGI